MYNKQFLLTVHNISFLKKYGIITKLGNFNIFYGNNLEFCKSKYGNTEVFVIGNLYSWEEPELSNQLITDNLAKLNDLDDLISKTNTYAGDFIVFFTKDNNTIIFNDAGATKEIFYDSGFTTFGSQLKLISTVINLKPHTNNDAKQFHQSIQFKEKLIFTGNTTHAENIKHLLANHLINVNLKKIIRFFPQQKNIDKSLDYVAQKGAKMLKGYIKAASLRNKLAIAVTGGYDSRLLFLASLDKENCMYFVIKHQRMSMKHYDITIPTRLTSIYNKELLIIDESKSGNSNHSTDYKNSIDFPRFNYFPVDELKDLTFTNGNISEVAKNFYGYFKHINADDLANLNGCLTSKYAIKQYSEWLKENSEMFLDTRYNLLDIFYWEEKMSNWAAKTKTEYDAMGINSFSPFNSRSLLTILLSTDRKHRDTYSHELFNRIVYYLSNNNKEVIKIPINPGKKQKIIRFMKKIKIYNTYSYISLQFRKMKKI